LGFFGFVVDLVKAYLRYKWGVCNHIYSGIRLCTQVPEFSDRF
jgi:hypothetical protein